VSAAALALTLTALGLLGAALRLRAVLAGLTAGLAAVAAAASFVPEQAAPRSLAIALALTLISTCLIVVGQLVWRALEEGQ
jgi:hypothetical protein